MRRSKIRAYIHFVWATAQRLPVILPEYEADLYHCISAEAARMKCEVLAIGGMEDHVHLFVAYSALASFGEFMRRVKGVSSKYMKDQVLPTESFFYWQEGYGLFTVSPSHVNTVSEYVLNQKQHHTEGTLRPALEEPDEETPTP